ncbi:MAG: nucleotidyltransferase domain-containing protein [Nitrospirota bacterium]
MLQEIACLHRISLIILFGSKALGKDSKNSDIDLGILFDELPSDVEEEKVLDAFIHLFRTDRLDIVVLSYASPLLLFQVATKGKPIYENVFGSFFKFSIMAHKKYWESEKFRKLKKSFIDREIRKLKLAK